MTKGKRTTSASFLREVYTAILRPRLIEEKMLLLLRQGRISKWFSGIGQEAISVGSTLALNSDEYILPLHRNLGVFTGRGIPLWKLIAQWQGKLEGFTKGRDRSFHFGTNEHAIVGMISHLGPQLAVGCGIALAHKLRGERKITLVFTGEGGTSEGDFHEALNIAAVWDLPIIFIIENNGYALSTPTPEQFRCEKLSDKAVGYGIAGVTIDGNDILKVYETVSKYATDIRKNPKPILIECMTFRMRGHEEASGTAYVPKTLLESWSKRDPVLTFEAQLFATGEINETEAAKIKQYLENEIEEAVEKAFALPEPTASVDAELKDVFCDHKEPTIIPAASSEGTSNKRFIDAITDALDQALQHYPELVIMGQDIADYGGVFKVTEGLAARYGKDRIRNTPLCESGIVGAALGLSICGIKSIVEMQFADFVSCGFNQIVNNLAKSHYRWNQKSDVVIRMPTGAGTRAGPYHSQSNEAWFTHTPGLKVVYPSNPHDAKGLLLAALSDPNPVLYFEHKALYRRLSGPIPNGYYVEPIGKARVVSEGSDISIITYGMGVVWAEDFASRNPDLSIYVLDLRTLVPLDYEAIRKAVEVTHRVIVLHEATLFGGIGGEISAWIGQHCFEHLEAPVTRVASLDTPVPFAANLEDSFLGSSRLAEAVQAVLEY